VTEVAAKYLESPPCEAVIEQVPALTSEMVRPEMVQTAVLFEITEADNDEEVVTTAVTGLAE
jgi:hypothetical protein